MTAEMFIARAADGGFSDGVLPKMQKGKTILDGMETLPLLRKEVDRYGCRS